MKILLGTLEDKGDELATFLEPRIGAKPEVGGGELSIDDSSLKEGIRSRHVKTYIKRFLYRQKVREDYRVLVEAGELRIVEIEREEEEEEEKEKEKKGKEEKAEKGEEKAAEEEKKEEKAAEEEKKEEKAAEEDKKEEKAAEEDKKEEKAAEEDKKEAEAATPAASSSAPSSSP